MKFQLTVSKTSEEYYFKNGCIGKYIDNGFIESPVFQSLNDLLEYIRESYGEPVIFDSALQVSRLENKLGGIPSEQQINEWKNKDLKLFNVSYIFDISEVNSLYHDELVELFSELENQGEA